MSYTLRLTQIALKDIEKHKKAGDIKILRKIGVLLNELRDHPKTGTGKPKQLKHNLEGFYSRKIDKKHRLIYQIEDDIITVFVLSAFSHYEDK